jgi:hypothetical protein
VPTKKVWTIDDKIKLTDKGVRVDLQRIYVYPDGHGNIIFKDGDTTNWPFNDMAEAVEILVAHLLRPMWRAAKANRGT